tara:strand:- start:669 stop:1040 length:372 start_codon:yes stop_codon:yes gene_type:complete
METLYEYKADRIKDLQKFTVINGKMVFKRKDTTVNLSEQANDLRYCDWGIQAIWHITISFPFGHIFKTIKRTDDQDFSKAEKYINTKLQKYGFDKINIIKDSEQIGASPASYRISNITKKGRA